MTRHYVWNTEKNKFVERVRTASKAPMVQADLADFVSPDGSTISGRARWREHLKRTEAVEMGHSDIKAMEDQWQRRKSEFGERLRGPGVREAAPPEEAIGPAERSRVSAEIANRLHNRPAPDRTVLIKMALEEARRHRHG